MHRLDERARCGTVIRCDTCHKFYADHQFVGNKHRNSDEQPCRHYLPRHVQGIIRIRNGREAERCPGERRIFRGLERGLQRNISLHRHDEQQSNCDRNLQR